MDSLFEYKMMPVH